MRWLACLSVAFSLMLPACSRLAPPAESGELVVAIRADPLFYQPEADGSEASGFEYDLLHAFADELKLKLRLVPMNNSRQMLEQLRKGEIHFAAAMPIAESADFRFSQPLHEGRRIIVQHIDAMPLDERDDLADHAVEVVAGSPLDATLGAMKPPVKIVEVDAGNDIDLLARIAERRAELAATDSAHFDVAVNFFPDLTVAQELPGTVFFGWAFRAQDDELRRKADDFIARIRANGTLLRVHDRYYGHIKRVRPGNMAQFLQNMQTRLPHFRDEFQQAQVLTGIDWRLLAALAYQESAWDPLATSPTGVRGMMMLTEDTADRMRVSNRLDVRQSIRAGARYLADIIDSVPDDVDEPDRTWIALATYNLGSGHMNGARAFARALKRDTRSWYEMKQVLPLLARPQYYQRLKSGRARGGEAVIMVENIRNYFSVLARFEAPYVVPLVKPQKVFPDQPSMDAILAGP